MAEDPQLTDASSHADTMALQSRALRGSLWGLVSAASGIPLAIISTVALARGLGPKDFGAYAVIAFVLPTAASILDLGITTALLQRASYAFGRGERDEVAGVLGRVLTWNLLRWPLLALAGVVLLRSPWAIAAYLLATAISASTAGTQVALLATSHVGPLTRVTLLGSVGSALTTIALAVAHARPGEVYACSLLAPAAVTLLQRAVLRGIDAEFAAAAFRPRSPRGLRREARFGLATFAGSQLVSLTTTRTELLFFGGQSTDRGAYAGAFSVASRLTLPIDALYGALAPGLAAVGGADRLEAGTERAMRLTSALFLAACAPLLALVVVTTDALLGQDYAGAAGAAVVLSAASLLLSLMNPVTAYLFARRDVRPVLAAAGASLLVNVTLCAVLIPAKGLNGAVIANVVGGLLYVGLLLRPLLKGAVRAATRRLLQVVVPQLLILTGYSSVVVHVEGLTPRCMLMAPVLLAPIALLRWQRPLHESDVEAIARAMPRPAQRGFRWCGARVSRPSAVGQAP